MASILPNKKKQSLGFKGLVEDGEQSHWAFYMLLYCACIVVLSFCFLGIFLSYGNYLLSLGFGFISAAFLYASSYIAEKGKVKGNNLSIGLGLFGLIAISFTASYLGNHYLHHALNKGDKQNSLIEKKLRDLQHAETVINFYQKRYNQLDRDSTRFRTICDYNKLDSINWKCKGWKQEIVYIRNQIIDPLCFILYRDDILNTNLKKVNFSEYKDQMINEIKNHNDSWVANARCQVDIPIESQVNGYITPMNIPPPTTTSSWNEMSFIIFFIIGLSILILALMPFFAAKGAETILKSR